MAGSGPIFCASAQNLRRTLSAIMPQPVAVVGIGNPLRGDDGFGPAVIARLRASPGLRLFDVQAVPESYLMPIVDSGCGGVLFVDAADLGAEPGRVAFVASEGISETDVSTHAIALSLVADAIVRLARESHGHQVVCGLVAAQPADLDVADRLSPAVEKAVRLAAEGIQSFAGGP